MSADVNGLDALLHSDVDEKTLKEITGDLKSQLISPDRTSLNNTDRTGFIGQVRQSGDNNNPYQFANGNNQYHHFGPAGFDSSGGGWNAPAISVASTSAASLFNTTSSQAESDRIAQGSNGPILSTCNTSATPNVPRFKVVSAPSIPTTRPPSAGNYRLPRPPSNEGIPGPTATPPFSGDFAVKTESRSITPVTVDISSSSSSPPKSFNGQTGSFVTVSSTTSANGNLTQMFNVAGNRTTGNSLRLPTSCSNATDGISISSNSSATTGGGGGGGVGDQQPVQPYVS